jgi:hypothetical protein
MMHSAEEEASQRWLHKASQLASQFFFLIQKTYSIEPFPICPWTPLHNHLSKTTFWVRIHMASHLASHSFRTIVKTEVWCPGRNQNFAPPYSERPGQNPKLAPLYMGFLQKNSLRPGRMPYVAPLVTPPYNIYYISAMFTRHVFSFLRNPCPTLSSTYKKVVILNDIYRKAAKLLINSFEFIFHDFSFHYT